MAKSASLPNGNTDPSPSSSTSVFNALGSYADRIREKELKEGSVAKKDKSPNTATTDLPNGTSSHAKPSASSSGSIGKGKASMVSAPPPASTSSGKAKGKTESQSQNGKAEEKEKSAEEEGAWETVPAGRTRRKERDSTVSTNWRERPKERKEAGWRDEDKSKNGERGKKGTMAAGSTGNAPPSSSTTAALPRATNVSSNTQATPSSSTRSASVTPASSTRNPWGIVAPSPASGSSSLAKPRTGTSTPPTSSTTTAQTPKSAPRPATTPSSPSINAIGTTTSISATTSTASPNLSSTADTASTATVVTPRNGEDGDWRIRPRKLSTEMVDQDTTLVDKKSEKVEEVKEMKKTAAPPVVNAWAERRKAVGQPSTATIGSAKAGFSQSTAPATSSSPILFGSAEIDNPRPLVNGDAGPSGDVGTNTNIPSISSASKKKKTPQMSGQTRHVVDPNAFPDLASAQQVSTAKKGEKERSKEKESEESSVVDESGVAARKTKWTAIPAAELLAAADEAAETQRRMAREQAARRARPPMPLAPDHLQSPVKQTRKKSVEARRGRTMRAGSGSELRLPPNPFPRPIPNGDASTGSTTVSATAQEFKPVFGNFTAGAGTGAKEQAAVGLEGKTGHSEPMSRQTSGSAISSPQQRSQTQLPSPTKLAQIPDIQIPLDMAALKMGMPGGPKSATEMGSNTTPIPQTGFPTGPGGPAIRGRGQRQSFSGRGRGGFRGGAGVGGGFKASNSAGDVAYLNNYGPGRGGGYGMTQNGYDQGYGVWDPMQGYGIYPITQMGGRTAQGPGQAGQQGQGQTQGQVQGQVQGLPMPPPPMPVTMAVGLDALRFYVLGQVEYYFSMQNLAMDFFLRQQMDSEGWIDISMISSFNRIKSLTPDPSIIKEVMLLSSLLEVREDKVRLSHGESKRWVLPDAKPSPFTDDSTDENHSVAGGSGDNGDEVISGAAGGMDMGLVGWGSIPMTNGSTDNGGREGLAQDVKDALMKRGPSAPASTTTGTGTSTETGTETGTGSGTRTNTENGDMEDDEGKIRGEMEETPGTSLSGEEAEKVELR